MKILLAFIAALTVSHAASIEEQWQQFKFRYGKTYKSLLDEKRRFDIFQSNVRGIEKHNARFVKEEVSYSKGINQFTDLTQDEFASTLTAVPYKSPSISRETFNDTGIILTDEDINYVISGRVSSIKNQCNCGSSWAFSAVGAIEGQVAKSGQSLVSLSAQNLVDCSRNGINQGCDGGRTHDALDYVISNGVLTEAEYPYVGQQQVCKKKGGQKISAVVDIAPTEAALLKALAIVGPICVSLDATYLVSYSGGIFDASSGCTSNVNHGALLVGAGTEDRKDYYLIKNSWGSDWGLKGYFKLIRNKNACGITTSNSYPKL